MPPVPRIPGVRLPEAGPPRQSVTPCIQPAHVAILGADYPGLRLAACVEPGAEVAPGQPVAEDRHHPRIRLTAPVGGTVEEIVIGPRRSLSRLVIRRGDTAEPQRFDLPGSGEAEGIRALMQGSGLWAALLRRPFGRVPDPDETPAAILVGAMATEPGAPDPAPIIAADLGDFEAGLDALARLGPGPVFVCHGSRTPPVQGRGQVRPVRFSGPHPAGATGVHAERLCPPRADRPVWQMGYAEVLALGALLRTAILPGERLVSVSGACAAVPRLLRLPLGADIEALPETEALGTGWRLLSGSPLSGHEARFLARRHLQITLAPRPASAPRDRRATPLKRAALIPHAALLRALGPDLPALALLRALSVGDLEQAERAGALALLEEDMALATYLTGGSEDFAARLRAVLDRLEAA
jgi:Na+-transporting NADH:ubiquinone oxidoreductase subunit A